RNRTLADLVERRRALRIQLEELRTGRDSLLRVVDVVAVSVEEVRERLASAEDEARVAAEEAGQRVAEEPDHDDLVELEAELAAVGTGVGDGGPGRDPGASSAVPSAFEDAAGGDAGAGLAESPVEGRPDQEASTSRRSVDELF